MPKPLVLPDETATEWVGQQLAKTVSRPCLLFLEGELGAGKTTMVRGFLRALGYTETVKSPTYTLVEEYQFEAGPLYHFDLYRLQNPQELAFMGLRDYFSKEAMVLIEWAEKGESFLPKPDLLLMLQVIKSGRTLEVTPCTSKGEQWFQTLSKTLSVNLP